MKHSTDRILTTHTGSLPRPDDLVGMLDGRDQREATADPDFQARDRRRRQRDRRQQVDEAASPSSTTAR